MFKILKTNKKGVIDFMLNYLLAIAALFLIISFFMIYFFVLGGADSSTVVIRSEEMQSSAKLISLLKTDITQVYPEKKEFVNMNFYDLLTKAYNSGNEQDAKEFRELLQPILKNMILDHNNDVELNWNFYIYEFNNGFIGDLIESLTIVGLEVVTIRGSMQGYRPVYVYKDEVLVPVNNNKLLLVNLVLATAYPDSKSIGGYI